MSKLVAIVGPTASGKSALAMRVARDFGGEIICADSRTIYKGLDIGTAKPSLADQKATPHHLLDVIEPDQAFSAAQFKEAAGKIIEDIKQRHHLPMLVGGTGLYAYAVLYDYQFPAGPRTDQRAELEKLSIEELVKKLNQLDPQLAATIDLKNPRRVVRAIETAGQPRTQSQLRPGAILVGLRPEPEGLEKQIAERTEQMIQAGLQAEVETVVKKFGAGLEVLRSPGYGEMADCIQGDIDLGKAKELINLHTRQMAKRQLTWFKRNADINWFEGGDEAYNYIAGQLRL